MPITDTLRRTLRTAFANRAAGDAVADAIDAANAPIPNVANLGDTSGKSDAERLADLEEKLDTVLAAMKASGKMVDDAE